MGLSTKNANGTFLGIREGKIVMRVTEPTDTSKARPKKGDETVIINEEFFDSLEGRIVGLRVVEDEYGKEKYKSWMVVINDDGTDYMLKVSQKSRYGSGLMSRIENVDFSKPVEVVTYWIKQDDGTYKGYLNLKQDGQKVEQKYTRENPNGLPPLESVELDGKKIWSSQKQSEFFEAIVARLAPNIIAANAAKNDVEKPVQAETKKTPQPGLAMASGQQADDPGITEDDASYNDLLEKAKRDTAAEHFGNPDDLPF